MQCEPITLNDDFFRYIALHAGDDAMRLRLKRENITHFPLDLAITQVEIRNRRIEKKLPQWAENERVVFPSLLSTEQCSSQATARYKQSLVRGHSLCDLTGGLGVDLYFMSRHVERATYVEQNKLYCECAAHNFKVLDAGNITVVNSDCADFLNDTTECYDTIFIDPARRGNAQERLFALADCEPNVLAMMPLLKSRCKRLIIKLSTMVDVSKLQEELEHRGKLYVVSLHNECKEILAVIDTDANANEGCITCVLVNGDESVAEYSFDLKREAELSVVSSEVAQYLYEPDAALLKAGVFKSICHCFNVDKLHRNSHLYTSASPVKSFAGRCFKVIEVLPFSSRLCRDFSKKYGACNITTRNFAMSAVELRKKLKVRDGGDIYLFATTNCHNDYILVVCNKI